MRPNNSLGGYRIYPTSPEYADTVAAGFAIVGKFNEGMDRLNRDRQLTETERQLLDQLNPDSQLAKDYTRLQTDSNQLWQRALQKQQSFAQMRPTGPYTMNDLGQLLIRCADHWQSLKRRLDAQSN